MNIIEYAKANGISPSTVRKYISDGQLKTIEDAAGKIQVIGGQIKKAKQAYDNNKNKIDTVKNIAKYGAMTTYKPIIGAGKAGYDLAKIENKNKIKGALEGIGTSIVARREAGKVGKIVGGITSGKKGAKKGKKIAKKVASAAVGAYYGKKITDAKKKLQDGE
jgi:hypothetical protein